MMIHAHKGFSLIEVLVTIVILVIGLLGLAGLQSRALSGQMESYQRSQALVLLRDMAGRIYNNPTNAASYVTTTPLGTLNTTYASCIDGNTGSVADDMCEWNNALLGAAETSGTSTNVGAMIGARGCVTQIAAATTSTPGQYLVTVAWQGLNPTIAPAVSCGKNSYGSDQLRRTISLPITIAILQ